MNMRKGIPPIVDQKNPPGEVIPPTFEALPQGANFIFRQIPRAQIDRPAGKTPMCAGANAADPSKKFGASFFLLFFRSANGSAHRLSFQNRIFFFDFLFHPCLVLRFSFASILPNRFSISSRSR